MAFPSRADYKALVYGIPESKPEHIRASTLRLYSVSAPPPSHTTTTKNPASN